MHYLKCLHHRKKCLMISWAFFCVSGRVRIFVFWKSPNIFIDSLQEETIGLWTLAYFDQIPAGFCFLKHCQLSCYFLLYVKLVGFMKFHEFLILDYCSVPLKFNWPEGRTVWDLHQTLEHFDFRKILLQI